MPEGAAERTLIARIRLAHMGEMQPPDPKLPHRLEVFQGTFRGLGRPVTREADRIEDSVRKFLVDNDPSQPIYFIHERALAADVPNRRHHSDAKVQLEALSMCKDVEFPVE